MATQLTQYRIELLCAAPQWWNFNIYVMAVCCDEQGNRIAFNNLEDRVRDIGYGSGDIVAEAAPTGERVVTMTTDPCAYAELYVYVVANTLPPSRVIRDTPPFPLTLRTSADGVLLEETEYGVNQLGGLTIVAHRVGK